MFAKRNNWPWDWLSWSENGVKNARIVGLIQLWASHSRLSLGSSFWLRIFNSGVPFQSLSRTALAEGKGQAAVRKPKTFRRHQAVRELGLKEHAELQSLVESSTLCSPKDVFPKQQTPWGEVSVVSWCRSWGVAAAGSDTSAQLSQCLLFPLHRQSPGTALLGSP